MLLTLSTTHTPATDLGFLLYKNPARLQAFPLTFGTAHVFYPEASPTRCTAALLVEIDPIALVRNRRGPAGDSFALQQYVNDRPYAASSFLSVAIAEVFGSALSGASRERPQLVTEPLPLQARLSTLPSRGGEQTIRNLFEPLGYTLTITQHPLDPTFPAWSERGGSRYYDVTLSHTLPLRDLLRHLYILIPVLDGDKHYWIGDEEVEKLLRHGAGWLANHPAKDAIVDRYLKHRRHLTREALSRLLDPDTQHVEDDEETHTAAEEVVEAPIRLNDQRHDAVIAALLASGATSVLDLGCSTGKLLERLLHQKQFSRITGLDVSYRTLEIAAEKLHFDRLPEKQRARINLIQGSLTYRDARLAGYDAAAVVEVIEHLDEPRLAAFERVLFEFARPKTVLITTPNIEHNIRFPTLAHGAFRHKDHRFEWTRSQFQHWATQVATRHHYSLTFTPIGPNDPEIGPPTQMATFTLS